MQVSLIRNVIVIREARARWMVGMSEYRHSRLASLGFQREKADVFDGS